MITRRENLMRVFRHEKPEWIPIGGHCDPYNQPKRDGMDPELAEKLKNVRWSDESTVHFSRYLDLDITDWYSPPLKNVPASDVTTESRTEGEDTITVWHTPVGDLRQIMRRQTDDLAYRVEHFLKSPDDLAAMAYCYENSRIEIDQDRVADLEKRRTLIGDDGIIMATMPGTPLSELIRNFAGVETTAYLVADAPDAVHDLFNVMTARHIERASLAASLEGCDAIVGVDDTSTTTQSPAMFEEYCVDYTNRISDAVHEHGKLYFHHSCGLIRDLVGLYAQTRMDAVHAFQLPPMGNISVRDGKKILGDRIVIYATLNQAMEPLDDWDAVCASIKSTFEEAAPGDNFMLGMATDPNVTMADAVRVREVAARYQRMC